MPPISHHPKHATAILLCHSKQREESKILIRQTHKLQQPPLHPVLPSDRETPHTNPKHNPILNSQFLIEESPFPLWGKARMGAKMLAHRPPCHSERSEESKILTRYHPQNITAISPVIPAKERHPCESRGRNPVPPISHHPKHTAAIPPSSRTQQAYYSRSW